MCVCCADIATLIIPAIRNYITNCCSVIQCRPGVVIGINPVAHLLPIIVTCDVCKNLLTYIAAVEMTNCWSEAWGYFCDFSGDLDRVASQMGISTRVAGVYVSNARRCFRLLSN